MQIRPDGERKMRADFQRRVDEQASRYATELAHAEQLAARLGYGEVVGVFHARGGGGFGTRARTVGLLPLAAVPVLLIAGSHVRVLLAGLLIFPFAWGIWFGLTVLFLCKRDCDLWFYAFAAGFMFFGADRAAGVPVRWSQVAAIGLVWKPVYEYGEMDPNVVRNDLTAYRLSLADGRAYDITSEFRNVRDPYGKVGQMLRTLMPVKAGQVLPKFPTIDEVIATYTSQARRA